LHKYFENQAKIQRKAMTDSLDSTTTNTQHLEAYTVEAYEVP